MLDVYGNLFFAGARTLERLLPSPRNAQKPVVIIRLRGQSNLGATLVDVLSHYADELEEVDGQLYLTGVSEDAHRKMKQTSKLRLTGPVRVYEATAVRGQATNAAYMDAQAWLAVKRMLRRRKHGPIPKLITSHSILRISSEGK